MGVGQGEKRKESEGQSAEITDSASSLDPVVTLVMGLFAPPAVTNNRIAETLRTASNDQFRTSLCPVEGWVAMIPRTWDKQNRTTGRLSR